VEVDVFSIRRVTALLSLIGPDAEKFSGVRLFRVLSLVPASSEKYEEWARRARQ
jgi:hypothetical protein